MGFDMDPFKHPLDSAFTELHAQLETLRDEWQRAALLLIDAATELRLRDPTTVKALQDLWVQVGRWQK